jgi:hypothetical protein
MCHPKSNKKKRIREALTTGLGGCYAKPPKVTTENIKKSRYYDHFKNGLNLTITQIKALLNAPSFMEAKKLEAKMPKKVPRFAAYQVRKYWGYKAKRIERCFVCNKKLYFEEEDDQGDSMCLDTPSVYFRTHGNWPSTILDMEDETIEILICDDCIKARKNRMFVVEDRPPRPIRQIHIRKSFKQHRDEQIAKIKKMPKNKRPRAFRIT